MLFTLSFTNEAHTYGYGTCGEAAVKLGHHAFSKAPEAVSRKYQSYGTFLQHFLLCVA